jgi:hypothetical protein
MSAFGRMLLRGVNARTSPQVRLIVLLLLRRDEQRVVDVFLFFDENDATFNLGGMGGGVSTVI